MGTDGTSVLSLTPTELHPLANNMTIAVTPLSNLPPIDTRLFRYLDAIAQCEVGLHARGASASDLYAAEE
jgi:hypothetical protein